MGTWGIEPWESDLAADWFIKMFDKTLGIWWESGDTIPIFLFSCHSFLSDS